MRVLPNLFANRPHVAEHDFSGVIVDANGTSYSNGDNVFGWIPSGELHPHPFPVSFFFILKNASTCRLTAENSSGGTGRICPCSCRIRRVAT